MARMAKRLSPLVGVVLAVVLLAACSGGAEPQQDFHVQPPPLEEYLGILGYYAADVEAIQHQPAPSESEYRALVDRYRQEGMEDLSTEDRHLLLGVAQVAFEAYPDTLRYSVTAEEAGTGPDEGRRGEAVLEEVYRHPPTAPALAAMRVHGKAMRWEWLGDPVWYADAPDDTVGFVGEGSIGSEFVTSTVWEKSEGRWTCMTGSNGLADFALAEAVRLGILHDYAFGDLLGPDELDGHAAYKFHSLDRSTGREITYWLDAETLWLRQYEYEDDGIRYTVKLEAVNEDIVIEPPDVDVECVEEETE